MSTKLVKINIDSQEEIEKLHGVGMKLAERIVLYRTTHGYFLKPEDLAKVEGIGLNLAITLAPSIDWQVPESIESEKKLDWGVIVISSVGTLVVLWAGINVFQSLLSSISDFLIGYSDAWVDIWINVSLLLVVISFFAFTIFLSLAYLTKDRSLEKKYKSLAFRLVIPAFAGLISSGIGNAVRYQYYETQGWSSLLNNHPALLAIMIFLGLLLLFLPNFIVLWRPAFASSSKLAKVFDLGLFTLSAAFSLNVFFGSDVPWPIFIYNLLVGLLYIVIGINTIRTGHSFFSVFLDTFNILDWGRQKATISERLAWLNRHLPNPVEQKELKEALDKAYPSSRFRTILSTIVLGIGGWLVLTSVEAVIQRFVDRFMNRWFP